MFCCLILSTYGQDVPGAVRNEFFEGIIYENRYTSREDVIIALDTLILSIEMATGEHILMPELVASMLIPLLPMTASTFQAFLDIARIYNHLSEQELRIYIDKFTEAYYTIINTVR